MKATFLTLLAFAGLMASSASAATLYYDYVGGSNGGLKYSNGSTVAAGTVLRYGWFDGAPTGSLASMSQAQLEAAFHEIFTTTTADGTGTWNTSGTFAASGTYNGLPYDNSAGVDNNVAGDIAGEEIYLWVLNNASSGSATEQGIFSWAGTSAFTWADASALPNSDAFFSLSGNTGDGIVAHIGSLNASGGGSAHQLSSVSAVPEPSRALLGFFGIAAMLFRRRRA
jgi:hypothetical protein